MLVSNGEDSPNITSEQPRSELWVFSASFVISMLLAVWFRVLCRNDTDHFRMEEEMARLVADNEDAKAKNESLEKRLASLQNDFVS